MSKTNPIQPHDDEMLSAYVDGELTDDQRAMVEQRLRDDADAKALVDELWAISETMQSLPRQSPSENLRDAVLRRTATVSEAAAENNKQPMELGRRLFWPGLAVAAALMLMVYQSLDSEEQGPLAEASRRDKEISVREPPQPRAIENKLEREAHAGEQLAQSSPSELNASGSELSDPVSRTSPLAAESRSRGVLSTISGNEPRVEEGFALDESKSSVPDRSVADGAKLERTSSLEACEVHLTLNRSLWNSVQFDRLLRQHGIAVRGSEVKSKELADAAGGVGEGRSDAAQQGIATEKVLVEAPPARIEAVLAECYADAEHCFALSITTPAGQKIAPTERWRRLQRNGWATDKLDKKGLDKKGMSKDQRWQFGSSVNEGDEVRARSSASPKNRTAASDSSSAMPKDASIVRVLFVLHWQEAPASGDEPPQAVEPQAVEADEEKRE